MTEEQIKQNAEAYAEQHAVRIDGGGCEEEYDYEEQKNAYIAGAHSRDEEVKRLYNSLEHFRSIINNLRNPWISVEDGLPKIEDETEERTKEIFVCIKDGVYLVAHYSYFYKAWYAFNDKGGCMYRKIRTPRYWMPIPEVQTME